SDRLDVREAESVAEFSGNVSVVQGPTLLKAGKMVVYYAKNGGSAATGSAAIDRLVISGKVYVKSNSQIATGDQADVDMTRQVLVMTGKEVVLSDKGNVVKGCKLTVNMTNGRATFGGKCRQVVLIDPKSAPKQ
ncbi:MAG: LptA/OstA family protein, partial [Rhizobiaceae bacterium]